MRWKLRDQVGSRPSSQARDDDGFLRRVAEDALGPHSGHIQQAGSGVPTSLVSRLGMSGFSAQQLITENANDVRL